MYQALYRKYRPRTFDDVAGQEHITKTLKNQVTSGRSSHAYLFVGTRGTGKTTCAKLLARAVNCEHPVNGNPCNTCDSCLSIESGQSTDVLEIDAASNNGVDNVRDLRDEAVYSPVAAKLRVYIIDEVHMLSGSAFNALLKILEEPPEHLLFILATTELHKVPKTVLSRCQRFSFRRPARETVAERLVYIAENEGFELTSDAAALLSRLSDGSFRDGISLLDQCTGHGNIDTARVREVLGLPEDGEAVELLLAVGARDAARSFFVLDSLYTSGREAASLFDELSELARDALILTLIPGGGNLLSGTLGANELRNITKVFTPARLTHVLDRLARVSGDFKRGAGDRLIAEICLASLCDERLDVSPEALAARLEALERRPVAAYATEMPKFSTRADAQTEPELITSALPPESEPFYSDDDGLPPWDEPEEEYAPPVYASAPEPELEPEPEIAIELKTAPEPMPELEPEPEADTKPVPEPIAPKPQGASADDEIWQRILSSLPIMMTAPITNATARLTGDMLTVSTPDAFVLSLLGSESVSAAICGAVKDMLGRDIALKATLSDAPAPQIKLDDLAARFGSLGGIVEYQD